jgi:hypothetical protein
MIPSVTIEFCDEEDFRANRELKGKRRTTETRMKSLPVTGIYTSGYVEVVEPKEDKKE